jgi:hypothetical protein
MGKKPGLEMNECTARFSSKTGPIASRRRIKQRENHDGTHSAARFDSKTGPIKERRKGRGTSRRAHDSDETNHRKLYPTLKHKKQAQDRRKQDERKPVCFSSCCFDLSIHRRIVTKHESRGRGIGSYRKTEIRIGESHSSFQLPIVPLSRSRSLLRDCSICRGRSWWHRPKHC